MIVLTGAFLQFRVQQTALWRLFWLPILFLVVIVSIEVFAHDTADLVLVGLLVGAVAIVEITSLPNSFQLPGYDEYADLNFANTIISTGRWDPSLGVGAAQDYYGWYPAVHFFLSIWTIVLGKPLLSVMKYGAPAVIFTAVFAASKMVTKRAFSANSAYSVLLYVSSVGFMTLETSRRTISLIMGLLFISLAFQTDRQYQSRSVTLLQGVLVVVLAISDHFTSFIILAASLFGICILRAKRLPAKPTLNIVALAFLVYFAWYIMVAIHVFATDVTVLSIFLADLARFQRLVSTVGPSNLVGYDMIERSLVFLAQGIFGTCALLAVIARRKVLPSVQSLTWGLLGLATMGSSAVLAFSEFNVLSITLYGYAALPVSALAGATLHALISRKKGTFRRILAIALILIMFSGSMLVAFGARTLDYFPDQTPVIEEPREFTAQQIVLGQWASAYVPIGRELLGDRGSYVMLSGLYNLQFVHDFTWPAKGLPANPRSYFILKGDCYFVCPSGYWVRPDQLVESELASYNRIFDDGTWQVITGP